MMIRKPLKFSIKVSILLGLIASATAPSSAKTSAAKITAPLPGFADLHVHLFSELAFGGGWLHGNVEGVESKALKSCTDDERHARVKIPFVSSSIGKILNGSGDTGSHASRANGYPTYLGWPLWDTTAHQQAWEGWLKTAHAKGLNLVVVSATEFRPLCQLMAKSGKRFDCDEMNSVERQIEAAKKFAAARDWVRVATSAAEAREIIHSGKLALVLSFEVDEVFGTKDWRKELARFQKMGVRTFQLTHELDNRFAGAALHNPVFQAFQALKGKRKLRRPSGELVTTVGFDADAKGHNRQGLTDEGRSLVTEMMRQGMMIDLAHLSEVTIKEIADLSAKNQNYPLYVSHGHARDIMDDGRFDHWEHSNGDDVLKIVKDSGGIYGLRTAPEKTKKFSGGHAPNDCAGSSKSFAQAYEYLTVGKKLKVAFGSDLNGFIQQTRPRFGGTKGACGAEADEKKRMAETVLQKNPLGSRFDFSGLGRIDQLPDLREELKNFGVDVGSLDHSAENFVRMWERAEEISKGK